MNIGQRIKAFVTLGLNKTPRWIDGTFLDEVPEGSAMIEVRGNKLIVESRKVKKYTKLSRNPDGSSPEEDEFVEKHWESLKSVVLLGVAQLLQSKYVVEVNEEEKIISVENGWISIAPGIVDRESIVEFAEHPTWTVSMAVQWGGGYWDPPDVDLVEVGHSPNVVNVAELFVNTIWKESNRGFWESAMVYDY
jgi:hypothetical protein